MIKSREEIGMLAKSAAVSDAMLRELFESTKPGTWVFKARVALAATLSGSYGIYNGFELLEHEAIPGKEEYLNSEKYELKVRDWDRPGNIKDYIACLNRIRRDNAALLQTSNLRFGFTGFLPLALRGYCHASFRLKMYLRAELSTGRPSCQAHL